MTNTITHFIVLSLLFLFQSTCVYGAADYSNPSLLGWGSNFEGRLGQPIFTSTITPELLPKFNLVSSNNYSWNPFYGLSDIKTEIAIITPMITATVIVVAYQNETQSQGILGNTIYVSGDNSNYALNLPVPPYYYSTFVPLGHYLEANFPTNPLKNKLIKGMKCFFTCLILTKDNRVFWYQFGSTMTDQNVPLTFTDPFGAGTLTVEIVEVHIAGVFSGETLFAVTDSGHVFSWGGWNNGIRANGGSSDYQSTPTLIPTLQKVASMSVSFRFATPAYGTAAAINTTGHVLVWGSNADGAIGLGTNALEYSSPTLLPLDYENCGRVMKIVMMNSRGILKTENNHVYAFGLNINGEATGSAGNGGSTVYNPYNMTQLIIDAAANVGEFSVISDVETSGYACFCKLGHTFISWGLESERGRLGSGPNIGKIDTPEQMNEVKSFYTHTLLAGDTSVYGFGSNYKGEMGYGDVKQIRDPSPIYNTTSYNPFDGEVKSVILRSSYGCSYCSVTFMNGSSTLHSWGYCVNSMSLVTQTYNSIASLPQVVNSSLYNNSQIVDIQITSRNGLILNSNGVVYGWGLKDAYQFGNDNSGFYSTPVNLFESNPELTATKVRVGTDFFAIQLTNGSIIVRGSNSDGNLGTNPESVKEFTILDTSIATLNDPLYDFYTCGKKFYLITLSGKVFAMGNNANKVISPSSEASINTLTRITGGLFDSKRIIKVSCGYTPHFLTIDGYVLYYLSGSAVTTSIPNSELAVDISVADNGFQLFKTNKNNIYGNGNNVYFQSSPSSSGVSVSTPTIRYSSSSNGGKAPLAFTTGDDYGVMVTVDAWSCFGISSENSSVCSGKGFCISKDNCRCFDKYLGNQCQILNYYPPDSLEQKFIERGEFPRTYRYKMSQRIARYFRN